MTPPAVPLPPLPPLPNPRWGQIGVISLNQQYQDAYSAQQMQDYARAAIVAYIFQEELPK